MAFARAIGIWIVERKKRSEPKSVQYAAAQIAGENAARKAETRKEARTPKRKRAARDARWMGGSPPDTRPQAARSRTEHPRDPSRAVWTARSELKRPDRARR